MFNVCCVISSHFSERVVLVFLTDDDVNLIVMQDWQYVQKERRLYEFARNFLGFSC